MTLGIKHCSTCCVRVTSSITVSTARVAVPLQRRLRARSARLQDRPPPTGQTQNAPNFEYLPHDRVLRHGAAARQAAATSSRPVRRRRRQAFARRIGDAGERAIRDSSSSGRTSRLDRACPGGQAPVNGSGRRDAERGDDRSLAMQVRRVRFRLQVPRWSSSPRGSSSTRRIGPQHQQGSTARRSTFRIGSNEYGIQEDELEPGAGARDPSFVHRIKGRDYALMLLRVHPHGRAPQGRGHVLGREPILDELIE